MKKIKSVLYNIYSNAPYSFHLRDEYESLIEPVTDCVNDLNHSCNIHFDVGQYFFSDYDMIDKAIIPFIHIVISAPDTNRVEQVVEQAIQQNSAYRLFDKYMVDENALTQSNANMRSKIPDTSTQKSAVISFVIRKALSRYVIILHFLSLGVEISKPMKSRVIIHQRAACIRIFFLKH